jgi:hypothetical protein
MKASSCGRCCADTNRIGWKSIGAEMAKCSGIQPIGRPLRQLFRGDRQRINPVGQFITLGGRPREFMDADQKILISLARLRFRSRSSARSFLA